MTAPTLADAYVPRVIEPPARELIDPSALAADAAARLAAASADVERLRAAVAVARDELAALEGVHTEATRRGVADPAADELAALGARRVAALELESSDAKAAVKLATEDARRARAHAGRLATARARLAACEATAAALDALSAGLDAIDAAKPARSEAARVWAASVRLAGEKDGCIVRPSPLDSAKAADAANLRQLVKSDRIGQTAHARRLREIVGGYQQAADGAV